MWYCGILCFSAISFRTKDVVVNETEKEAHVCVEKIGITEMDISLTIRSSELSDGSSERAEGTCICSLASLTV